jgi:transposase
MAYNFLRGDRDQPFLLPPDLRDWLPKEHLAWFVLDVVDQLDLAPFYRQHRTDGHGHPAYDPKTLLGVLLYGYCVGVRSSRQIERRCTEDIAFRVPAGNQAPDHVAIARFRVRHQQALAGFLVESLRLCAAAGMVRVGTAALDGTKVAANAADKANRTFDKVETEVAEILMEAAETDQQEDREHGSARGEELPAELANPTSRLARLHEAKARLEAEAAERQHRYQQRVAELAAGARARGQQPRAWIKPRRQDEAPNPKAIANVTDPDSRLLHTRKGSVQGYNAQAMVTEQQIVVAAELTQDAYDVQQLQPMLQAVNQTLAAAEIQTAAGHCWPTPATVDRQPHRHPRRAPPAHLAVQDRPHRQAPQGRQALGVQEPPVARRDVRHARKRAGPGRLRPEETDRGAGGRAAQGAAGRPTVHPPLRRLRRRAEAVVRHPQPAQAVAPHPSPSRTGGHLSGVECRSRQYPPAPVTARPRLRLGRPALVARPPGLRCPGGHQPRLCPT